MPHFFDVVTSISVLPLLVQARVVKDKTLGRRKNYKKVQYLGIRIGRFYINSGRHILASFIESITKIDSFIFVYWYDFRIAFLHCSLVVTIGLFYCHSFPRSFLR